MAWIYWDPNPQIFFLPFVHWPIFWYGIFFALAFILGFPLFVSLLIRFFYFRPEYEESDLLESERILANKSEPAILQELNGKIMRGEVEASKSVWQKRVAKSGCPHPERALARLHLDEKFGSAVRSLKRKSIQITDKFTLYVVLGTVIGARLGHFLFYERPSEYFSDPLQIFWVWKGGLASHGGVVGIILGVILFSYRLRIEGLTWVRLLDFLAIPTALGAMFIRIGNFFNQEILGMPTTVPWAIIFGHPIDHSLPVPRHPVQLYEALFYLAVFILLWRLSYRPTFFLARGKCVGLFLILVFGFRFCIEFLKTEQSHLLSLSSFLTMGQYLSLPAIATGFLFYFWKRNY